MKTVDEFCGQGKGYSRSITLRNKLIPVGKTQENLEKIRILENDKKRAASYQEVKNLIDDFHRSFIQDVLSNVDFEWGPLYDEFDLYQSKADKNEKAKIKPDLQKLQAVMRSKIVKKFTGDDRFKKLFAKELLSELLPEIIKSADPATISDKEEALKAFDKFSTYFTGFHENRKNLYSEEEKSTAISYRIVNENFPKFYSNVKLFEKLEKEFPAIISDTEESLKSILNGKKLKDIFNPESFNEVLTQTGIDFYNTIIGGIAEEAGTQKIQGFNEKINLARQQLPDTEKNKLRGKMVVLFKQILSDRETASFIPVGFENNEEVYTSIRTFKNEVVDEVINLSKETFVSPNDYNISEIYVPAKKLTAFSLSIFGHWSILNDGLFYIEEEKSKKALTEAQSEKIRKEIAKKDYNLSELQEAYEKYCERNNEQVCITVKKYFSLMELQQIENTKEKTDVMLLSRINTTYAAIDFAEMKNLQQEKNAATPIKEFLDEVQNLYHYLKLVDYRGEEEKDSAFYSKLDEIIEKLEGITALYNKVRNFVTKKPGEVKKFKLNFDCPTLANGWDENKESANDAILLRKENKYYLGIYNPKDKPKFQKEECNEDDCYEKMIYKLLPGPNKMLPKVFFSAKGQETFLPPKDLLLGYEEGKHKKGDSFDKDFMKKLIDWDKSALNIHEDWKNFGFKFSPTESYKDMSDFYKEVELQGYKITFQKIPSSKIDSLVDSGKLFLFQIYNKDFAEKSSGKKNLHTLYWENLFSEENLKDICLKLNGEAELFYRPANVNIKIVKHEKGSVLVNRTTTDEKSIPEEIYQEIYQFKNNMISEISKEAKELLDSGTVVLKEAKHEITKDKHFTEATYLFHCPITMNFKAPEITGRKFNDRVLEVLKANPDVKIIGLDRGERHLIYLSLINQKGEIELQKTLNLVEQVRNDKTVKVNYQEKLVQKEGDRDKARKNWQTIGNIKELKEGYLSNIVHEIAELMVKNNAIVVMEDLNFGFKRGRFAVERQVYQKFENMLIEKLNYLVFKDKAVTEPGGVLNAYQLTDKATTVSDVYKQCGWLFYIPAAYTSKIDPKTGFANLFNTAGLTNVEKKKEFFDKFDGIRYDSKEDCFVFSVDYSKLGNNTDYLKKWEIYTRGERIVYSRKENKTITVNPTENLKKKFDEFGVNWHDEENFIDSLQTVQAEKCNASFFDELLRTFNSTLQMRNSIPNSEIDYLISPVKVDDGTFFDSREQLALGEKATLPIDADANGAYHIALKGLYLLQNDFNRNEKGVIQNISNADWFRFVQEKEYRQ
ncbi:MAG: type V CRISPR-associated protein Cas12a/Cpf1 [Treponema sp.]|nr:type V CRISPR-associated protein Cas12a/Cpf1 [Treponema sp.]